VVRVSLERLVPRDSTFVSHQRANLFYRCAAVAIACEGRNGRKQRQGGLQVRRVESDCPTAENLVPRSRWRHLELVSRAVWDYEQASPLSQLLSLVDDEGKDLISRSCRPVAYSIPRSP
jgi:hypothetical protein